MKKNQNKKGKAGTDKKGVMALSFGALNLADYLTTNAILNSSGGEYNPIVDFFIRKNCFGIFKIATTLTGMLAIYEDEKPKIVSKALLGTYGAMECGTPFTFAVLDFIELVSRILGHFSPRFTD